MSSRLWMIGMTPGCEFSGLDAMNSLGLWMTRTTSGREQ